MTRPITPVEAKEQKVIPEFVLEAVNELIRENITDSGYFDILQEQIVERIKTKTERDFDDNWLNFGMLYRNWGWNVEVDRPGYNESYKSYYKFSIKR